TNDTVYRFRHKLMSGYILDYEADERYDVFLSLSFKEYVLKEIEVNHSILQTDSLKKYILDKQPFTEFYRNMTDVKRFTMKDSVEVNEIIKNGQIEKYFKKEI
ncbi:MAG: hypothetical protein JXR31_04775, partial [Prolixibacteraceae bacterium]|nr:hypothetical protein [Prolixibacteraceae bacterium]